MNSVQDYAHFIDSLCRGGYWHGKTSNSLLQCYESVLDIEFPNDYRYFFLTYGSGSKGGVEIAGYDPAVISDSNIIARTIIQRREYYRYPKNLVFFSDTGDGGHVCFDVNSWDVLEVYRNGSNVLGFDIHVLSKSFLDFLVVKFQQ